MIRPMPPEEFQAILRDNNWTTSGAARQLGVTRRTVQFYASGGRKIPAPTAFAARKILGEARSIW